MQSDPDVQRTRILFLCHDGKIYGAQNSLKLLVENLPPERYQIFVSFARGGPLVEIFQKLPHVTVLKHERIQGVKHKKHNILKQAGDVLATFLNMGRVLSLVKTIQQHRIDIVHTNSLVSFEGAFAAKLAGVPHIWHIRELFQDYNPRFHLILGKRLTKAIVHHLSSRVLCVSNYVLKQFTPYADARPNQYQTMYNAIECPPDAEEKVHAAPVSDTLNIAYTGRVSDGKRFQDVIDAFCLLKERWQDRMPFHLKVYGDFICEDFEQMVRYKIDTAGLAEHFELLGYRHNLDKCLVGMDLLLMPSSTEAFGRTMLEALVRGIPVVTSRSGAPLEVIEEGVCGFFHNPNSAPDLAACLEEIYAKRQELPEMRVRCVQHVREKFNLKQQIQQLDHLYQELLRRDFNAGAIPRPCWNGS
jgi:glycosyltransferase involved in cell wall biosynthesis